MKIHFGLIFLLSLLSISVAEAQQKRGNQALQEEFAPAITEQQENAAKNYIHEGLAAKKVEEMCREGRDGYKDICEEDQYAFKGGMMRKLEGMIPALTKAYAMFSSMGPGSKFDAYKMDDDGNKFAADGSKLDKDGYKLDENGNQLTAEGKQEPATEEKTDYCGYMAMASEAASTAFAAQKNEKSQQNYKKAKPESKQAAAFYSLAESHKTMAKAAKIQFYAWGATSACYVAYLAQEAYQGDWKVKAKLAASALIATYYKMKASAHEERYKLLLQMAKELPQAGDCNPFTDTNCFCAEETSKSSDPGNFTQMCIPKKLAARDGPGSEAYVCADQNGKADEDCVCSKTDTCADRRLKIAALKLGLTPAKMRDPLAALKPLSKGFSGGRVGAAADRNYALAKRALENMKLNKPISLNNKQKKLARSMINAGFPRKAAALLASTDGSTTGILPASALAGFDGAGFGRGGKDSEALSRNTIAKMKSGGSVGSAGRLTGSNPFGNLGKRKKSNSEGVIIEDFQKKAMIEAEIVQDTGVGIFEIISNRYKISAWQQYQENLK